MPWTSPPLESTSVPERDQGVARREARSAGGPASARNARRTTIAPHEHDRRADAARHRGEHAGQHAEVVLADRDAAVDRDVPVIGAAEHHPDREAGEQDQPVSARWPTLGPASR